MKYGAVIGNSHFALDKMDITFEGSLMTVSVTGNFNFETDCIGVLMDTLVLGELTMPRLIRCIGTT